MNNKCTKCNALLEPNAKFCKMCGEKVGKKVCPNCNTIINLSDIFCTGCDQKIVSDNNTTLSTKKMINNLELVPSASQGKMLAAGSIYGYNLTEEEMVTEIIKKEIIKNGENEKISIAAIEKRKNIITILYAMTIFICISLFFFHSHRGMLFLIFAIINVIFINILMKYNIVQYLKKEVKSRADEKIGYIVSNVMSGKINNLVYRILRTSIIIIAIIFPLFLFKTPHTIYEYDSDLNGYVIRFYTTGWLKNDTDLKIPREYRNKPVVGIRGEVFANVKTIKKVKLPDTIKEIRGQAFQYASNLEEINLPDGIVEIKGNTFEECNLKEITIPDSVTRIGGHAFRNNILLKKVNISQNSKLTEIGSSAFRDCYNLEEIYLPSDVFINERAFKGSSTVVKEYINNNIESHYKYSRYIYLDSIGKSELVNINKENNAVTDASIKLLSIEGNYGSYIFGFLLESDNGQQTFALSRQKNSYRVSEDLAVSIKDDFVFESYSNRVAITVYYN